VAVWVGKGGFQREAGVALSAGISVSQVCQQLGVSGVTFHRWRNKYGGMKAEDLRHLKQLEEENRRLKKLVADLPLDNQILKEVAEGNF
jgi:transposase-like protein